MKVKEYIEELKKLDPEKNIWQANVDYGFIMPLPLPEKLVKDDIDFEDVEGGPVNIGDYILYDIR